jgi:ParB family transcriptional regulator, chromosome partitioning protein
MNESVQPSLEDEQIGAVTSTEAGEPDVIGNSERAQIVTAMPIADIKVGIRHRKDIGDIAGLTYNISEIGLLHPIVATPDGTLIANICRTSQATSRVRSHTYDPHIPRTNGARNLHELPRPRPDQARSVPSGMTAAPRYATRSSCAARLPGRADAATRVA